MAETHVVIQSDEVTKSNESPLKNNVSIVYMKKTRHRAASQHYYLVIHLRRPLDTAHHRGETQWIVGALPKKFQHSEFRSMEIRVLPVIGRINTFEDKESAVRQFQRLLKERLGLEEWAEAIG